MNIDEKLARNIIKTYNDFKTNKTLSLKQYLELKEAQSETLNPVIISHLLQLNKHEDFLNFIAKYFMEKYILTRLNIHNVEAILYLIIFVLDDENLDTLLHSMIRMKCFYLCNLLAMLTDTNKHLFLCQVACRYFEDEYVLEKIIYPFLNKIPTFVLLGNKYEASQIVYKKSNTICKPFEGLTNHSIKQIPPPPSSTPLKKYKFKALKPPKSTWNEYNTTAWKIEQMHYDNKIRAKKLLLQASKVPERLAKARQSIKSTETKRITNKPTPVPIFKNINIKGNLTTTLREASVILKRQEEEIDKINNLLKGGYCTETIEKIEEEIKKENEVNDLKKIEANHLKGLLSHEDAILAKKRLLQINQEKFEKFKEERVELLAELDRWREEEQNKIQSLVEKCQNIKSAAKESEKKLLEQKQEQARIQQYEMKQMLREAEEEKMRDLEQKMEIIKEIKALNQIRCNFKEFDPTETPNLGLLCEMSIAELQERLGIMKMEMRLELEKKRKQILKQKEERQKMVENLKDFISQNKPLLKKQEVTAKVTPTIETSADIIALRQMLEKKRKLRNSFK